MLRIGAKRATAVDHVDALRLGLNHEPLEHAAAGECDEVARLERKHLLVALEPGPGAKLALEGESDLRDLAALGPGRGNAVDALVIAAMDQDQVGSALAHLVERLPDAFCKRLGMLGGGGDATATLVGGAVDL